MTGRALICFDGSADAGHAIAAAGELLVRGAATVLTVWEPVSLWAPYDPAAVLSGGLSRLAAGELGLDDIAERLAHETAERGAQLARAAGFDAAAEVGCGKPWRAICARAHELDASAIVIGARGLSRVQSALLGSVSAAVTAHARRPVLVVPSPPDGDGS